MGYYSEVGIKCEERAYKLLKNVCKKVNLMPDNIYKDGDEYILYWDWIKWYSEYEDVSEIEKILEELDEKEEENGYGYKFLRIGEDMTDTEERGNDFNIDFYIVRKIDIPDCLEEVKED